MSEEISREEIAALLARESMSEKMTREQAIDYFRTQTAYLGGKDKQACEIAILAIAALSAELCEDAISRQAVLEIVEREQNKGDALSEIEQLPSVTPKQRTGHWEWVQYDYSPKLGNWHCSECRCIVVECVNKEEEGGIPLYKYCPQCGAKIV